MESRRSKGGGPVRSLNQGEIGLYCGSANPTLAAAVAARLDVPLGGRRLRRFADSEIHFQIEESIRGQDIFILQSTSPPVNEHLMELLIMLDAFRRASAGRLTCIIPYYGYSRQEKKTTGREPITAKLVANLLTTAGADRVVSIDMHVPAIQGFFDIGMDHLTAVPLLAEALSSRPRPNAVVVAPDVGRVKSAERFAHLLGNRPLAFLHKKRASDTAVEMLAVVGDVEGRAPIIVDDIIATGGTLAQAVRALLAAGARPEITIVATHAVLSGSADQIAERLGHPAVREILVTDSVATPGEKLLPTLRAISIAPLLAETVRRLHSNASISAVFPRDSAVQPV
jgi:ribose-phosphate pyrophosphokinase